MAWPVRTVVIFVALPLFTVCAASLYYYYKKDREWKRYLQNIRKIESVIPIPEEYVGAVIGRAGESIKDIQEKTQTRIRFNKNQRDDEKIRYLKIFGEKEDVELAKKLISEIIEPKGVETVELLVPDDACGKIIGRCGDTVRAIMRKSNANIRVNRDQIRTKSRPVKISGTKEQIAAAKILIEDIVKEHEEQKALRSIQAHASPRRKGKNNRDNVGGQRIPQHERLLPSSDEIHVYVSSVASPSTFWIQLITPRAVELDHLVDEMTDYYCKEENQLKHKLEEVKKGQIVASKFQHDGKWYRVEVFDVKPNRTNPDESMVDVFYVDYGDSAFQRLGDLLEIIPEYLNLKFQAIEVSLAGVKPVEGKWSENVVDTFEDLVHSAQWKVMLAKVVKHKDREERTEKGLIPFVKLYDPDGPPGVEVGAKLIQNGLALYDETTDAPSSGGDSDDDDNEEIWDN